MAGYHTKKRLGQNFLKTKDIIARIAETVDPRPQDRIIEIGPGHGALTMALAASGARIVAVEYDRDLIGYLHKLLAKHRNVEVLNQDFLSYVPDFTGYKLVGNLPFNITSPVIDWAVANSRSIESAYFMVQQEVAARLASSAGSRHWSPISIFTQLCFDVKICFDIGPEHFQPPPKVTSSLIELKPHSATPIEHRSEFERVVRKAFEHRRKTLVRNLVPDVVASADLARELINTLGFTERCRAEELSTKSFLELTNLLVSRNIL